MRPKNILNEPGATSSSSQESVTLSLTPPVVEFSSVTSTPVRATRGKPRGTLKTYLSDIIDPKPGPSSADADLNYRCDTSPSNGELTKNGNTSSERKRKLSENRKNISEIWNHFKRISPTHCECNLCASAYVISGTGTMRTHLKTKHQIVLGTKQITSVDANLREITNPLFQHNKTMNKTKDGETDEVIDNLIMLPQSGNVINSQPTSSKTNQAVVDPEVKPALNGIGSSSLISRKKRFKEMKSRITSKIWNHFKRISSTHCQCNYCPRAYVINGTGTLRTHLKTKHYSIFLKSQGSSVSDPIHPNPKVIKKPRSLFRQNKKPETSDVFQYNAERAKEALARFIYMGGHSFSVPSEQAFVEFCQTLQPTFTPFSPSSLQNMVMESFINLKNYVISFLQSEDNSKFSFTTKIWPSPNNKYARLGVTISWMNSAFEFYDIVIGYRDVFGEDNGINVCNTFLEIANEFKLVDKMFCVTTDNASSSNLAFIDYLVLMSLNEESYFLTESWIHCLGNIINMAVQDSLGSMKPCFEKLRRLVSNIRATPQRIERFEEVIKTVDIKETSEHFNLDCTEEVVCIAEDGLPILDIETKWSSTYMLLGRSKELRPALDEISNNDDLRENQLSASEWEEIDSVLEFLQPFAKVLKYVEGVKNPSLPVVVPLFYHLLKKAQDFAQCSSNPELVRKGAVFACNKMNKHSPILAVVAAMDPRMKYKYFIEAGSNVQRNTLESVVKPTLKKLWDKYKNLSVENEQENEDPIRPMDELLDDMFPQESEEMDELAQYLSETCERRDTDVIAYWRFKSARWPRLARMARDISAAQATSATYQRCFVSSGRDVFDTSNRMKLKASTVEASVCLRSWMKSGIVNRREATTMLEILIHTDGSDEDV